MVKNFVAHKLALTVTPTGDYTEMMVTSILEDGEESKKAAYINVVHHSGRASLCC